MNVSLTQELENFVHSLVSSGMYYSASEVIRDGLRLLREQEEIKRIRTEELRKEIMLGMEDLRAGRYTTLETPEDFDTLAKKIKSEGRQKLKERKNGKQQNGAR